MLSLPNYLHFIFMKEIFAFCNIAVIPIRAEASHRSEMVSQLLFGEAYNIVDYQEEWVKIKSLFDNYEGYIDRRQIALIHESSYKKYYQDNFKPAVAYEPTEVYDKVRKCSFLVPQGSTLPFTSPTEHSICLGTEQFEVPVVSTISSYSNSHNNQHLKIDRYYEESIKETALSFLNAPYLWGGRTIFGIDCSGFTQAVYKITGKDLPRDASQQNRCGTAVSLSQARIGDLAFFANSNGKITHVGLLLGDGKIIHASGKVRIDRIDEKGIFCIERNEYSHQLHSIKQL